METGNSQIKNILNLLKNQSGFDFSGCRSAMLERRIQKRMYSTNTKSLDDYIDYLNNYPDEYDQLIDVFTINVSRFFRNTLAFEYLRKIILPDLFLNKIKKNDESLRVWSAGCSFGEEAYSVAIIIYELLKKENISIKPNIFATDIDKNALKQAIHGRYGIQSVDNVKNRILNNYFIQENQEFLLNPEIKKMVQFSFYDLLDENKAVPSESIYGSFDLVLCRNVLIYFEQEHQKSIFSKLYKSLKPNGYLVLGEAEMPIEGFSHKFKRENNCCKIYRKIG